MISDEATQAIDSLERNRVNFGRLFFRYASLGASRADVCISQKNTKKKKKKKKKKKERKKK